MNFLREAQSAFDFATYYPLLCKAIADNDSTTPGYTYEEINKISFLSHQHRIHLVDFLLTRLTNLGWAGKQKIVRILLQLCRKGHYEVRVLLRQRDGELRKAASQGGPPDPVLANTPQLFFNSSIQELLSYIFDQSIMKMDEEILQKGEQENQSSVQAPGYGSSSTNTGKYEGFGSTPIYKQESIVDQVCEMVGKVVILSETRKRDELEGLLKGDKGNYQPLSLPSAVSFSVAVEPENFPQQLSSGPPLYTSVISPRAKGHVAGRVGGGWGSDDEDGGTLTAKLVCNTNSLLPISLCEERFRQECFMQTLLEAHTSWPVDYDVFIQKCRESTIYNPYELLNDVVKEIKLCTSQIEEEKKSKKKSPAEVGVSKDINALSKCSNVEHNLLIIMLFVECCLNEDLVSVTLLSTHLQLVLHEISQNKFINNSTKMKSQKINLLLKALLSYT